MFLQRWISNLQDLLRSQSLEIVLVCIVLQYYPHDNSVCIHMYDECMKSIDSDVCHKLWSILLWHVRASLTDQRISGRPKRAKYKHFKTIREHTCDNSPTDFVSSSLKSWSSMEGVDTLQSCCVVLLTDSQYRSTPFFYMTFHIITPWRNMKILREW